MEKGEEAFSRPHGDQCRQRLYSEKASEGTLWGTQGRIEHHPLLMGAAMNCDRCHQPLIDIDYYGEQLVGCIECNCWRGGKSEFLFYLSVEDFQALREGQQKHSVKRQSAIPVEHGSDQIGERGAARTLGLSEEPVTSEKRLLW
jgi:hypothetical protein